jgi:hypothetical protein
MPAATTPAAIWNGSITSSGACTRRSASHRSSSAFTHSTFTAGRQGTYVRQPEQRPLAGFQRGEFTRHAVVTFRIGVQLGAAAQPVQPGLLLLRATPSIGEQGAGDAEHVASQLFAAERPDIGLQQPAECILNEVVGV